jgi:protein translocase SecG subunit
MILTILGVFIFFICCGIIVLTLLLNTKADSLGAAVTGASDNYRGAIGAEEQKRKLILWLSIAFVLLSLAYTVTETWFI